MSLIPIAIDVVTREMQLLLLLAGDVFETMRPDLPLAIVGIVVWSLFLYFVLLPQRELAAAATGDRSRNTRFQHPFKERAPIAGFRGDVVRRDSVGETL